jgi:UDP-glucuronate 4-epimerase
MQPGDVTATFADISRLKALTGYQPKITIEEGLPRFVDWHRRWHSSAAASGL